MSQSDEPVDPYLPPGQQPQQGGVPQQPSYPQQGHPQGYGQQGHGQDDYPGGYPEPAYASSGYQEGFARIPRGPEAVQRLRDHKPPAVQRLLQVMVAGAVVALLIGIGGLFGIDQLVAQTSAELDQAAVDSGMDTAAFSGMVGSIIVGVIVVSSLVEVALWLLFAWLFSRGQARVLGTVLGAINGAGGLFGLFGALSAVQLGLALVHLGLVIAGLVLLWRGETTAWFRAVAQARAKVPWN